MAKNKNPQEADGRTSASDGDTRGKCPRDWVVFEDTAEGRSLLQLATAAAIHSWSSFARLELTPAWIGVLDVLREKLLSAREVREALAETGRTQKGPAFHLLMGRMVTAGLVIQHYRRCKVGEVTTRERLYETSPKGFQALQRVTFDEVQRMIRRDWLTRIDVRAGLATELPVNEPHDSFSAVRTVGRFPAPLTTEQPQCHPDQLVRETRFRS